MAAALHSTPAADGFHMPGEFEPHAGCWMAWPERTDNWRLGAKPAQRAFAAVASAVAACEPVTMAVSDDQFENCRALLPASVRVVEMSTDDAWMRDIGPSLLVDAHGQMRGVDWRFNAWGGLDGGLYFPWDRDDRVAAKVLEVERAGRYRAPMVLEGGSIHVDGEGTVLTTEQCLLHPNRNPRLTRAQVESLLHEYLGAERTIWLGEGLLGDETDGHVDNIACFARPGVVLLSWVEDPDDPQHAICSEALARLEGAVDARGRTLEVVPVPAPGPLSLTAEEADGVDVVPGTLPRVAGERLAASYVNFYIANTRVIYPLLDERRDQEAGEILAGCFPDREVVGLQAREILLGGGNIHCITQQVPSREAAGPGL